MISLIIPTRDRPAELARTLAAIARLDPAPLDAAGGAEVIVVDNASREPEPPPEALANGVPVGLVRLPANEGAAARTTAARLARGSWLVMLDDDSAPIDAAFAALLADAPPDVAAIGAEITLPSGRRDFGGLPEVFVGCGAAVRRDDFLAVGGYDPSFVYYAEEYDLAARLIARGKRITHDRAFRVLHRKTAAARDMDRSLRLLVRNSVRVEERWAPAARRDDAIRAVVERCEHIARREDARAGFRAGLNDIELEGGAEDRDPAAAPTGPLTDAQYDRFIGLAAARDGLARQLHAAPARTARLAQAGKNAHLVERALAESGVEVLPPDDRRSPDALAIATLSPGPILDAAADLAAERPTARVLAPWLWPDARARSPSGAAA